jgi:hypothetical protein
MRQVIRREMKLTGQFLALAVSRSASVPPAPDGRVFVANVLLIRSLWILALTTLLSTSSVFADPIVVTSGQLYQPDDEPGGFTLVGTNGLVLSAAFPSYVSSPCAGGCAPGTLSLSTELGRERAGQHVISDGFAQAIVNGIQVFDRFHPGVLTGSLRFDAPTIVLPPVDPVHLTDVTAPFVFSGDVSGFGADDVDFRAPLFHVNLIGQGTFEMIFDFDFARSGSYPNPQLTYAFAPTPEPVSLVLFGTGVTGLLASRRARRR